MITGRDLVEKLYSNSEGNYTELDYLLERAFSEGYEYAQKEFGRRQKLKRKQERALHNAEMHGNKAKNLLNQIKNENIALLNKEELDKSDLKKVEEIQRKVDKFDKSRTAASREASNAVSLEEKIRRGKADVTSELRNNTSSLYYKRRGNGNGVIYVRETSPKKTMRVLGNKKETVINISNKGDNNLPLEIRGAKGHDKSNDDISKSFNRALGDYRKEIENSANKNVNKVESKVTSKSELVPVSKPSSNNSSKIKNEKVSSRKIVNWVKRNKKPIIGLGVGTLATGGGVYLYNKLKNKEEK